jgi:hypothetical protein
MNPALSPTTTGFLSSLLGQGLDVAEDVVGGDDGADHLDERHDGRRVEEVHAQHARGLLGGHGDLGDRQRGGVGGEDGVVGDDLVEGGEDLLLQGQVLGDGLDDELAQGASSERSVA